MKLSKKYLFLLTKEKKMYMIIKMINKKEKKS